MTRLKDSRLVGLRKILNNGLKTKGVKMTELQMIRDSIPGQYKKVQEAMIEYKRCQNLNMLKRKEKDLKELFRLVEEELKLSCKFNSRRQTGVIS
tara:strand:+ start:1435 stop:1719 length:285 start_codon:yes stop_codon:yes gene_type:complete